MFSLHLAQKGHPSKFILKNIMFNELFNVRAPAGGTARKAREAQKESNTALKKHHKNIEKLVFSRPRAKPPKKISKNREKVAPGRPK